MSVGVHPEVVACACASDHLSVPAPEEQGTGLSVLVHHLGPVHGLYGLVLGYTGLQCGLEEVANLKTS